MSSFKKIFGSMQINLSDNCYHGETVLTYAADSLITFHHFEGSYDDKFHKALAVTRGYVTHPMYHEWRLYLALQVQQQILTQAIKNNSEYSYAECGVGEAMTILLSNEYFKLVGGELYEIFRKAPKILIDTFEGIDRNLIGKHDTQGYITNSYNGASYAIIRERLEHIENVNIIKGSIPSILNEVPLRYRKAKFVHIDMNHHVPEISALDLFYFSMESGSAILLDDYSFAAAKQQRDKINEWCITNSVSKPINLPTGQGLIII